MIANTEVVSSSVNIVSDRLKRFARTVLYEAHLLRVTENSVTQEDPGHRIVVERSPLRSCASS